MAGLLVAGALAGLRTAPAWSQAAARPDETPRRGGVLRIGTTAEPPTIDCHTSASAAALQYLQPHYSTLLKISPDAYPGVVGDLAETWEVSKDRRTYTFSIRPGVRFHNGVPLTAADVAASWMRLRHPPPGVAAARRDMFADITSIETPDPATVVITLAKPNPSMLYVFASPWNCIYSAAMLKADPRYPEKVVVGTGPFRFVERVPGSYWVGERFGQYFQEGTPYLDGFRIDVMSRTELANALATSRVDVEFRGLSPTQRDDILRRRGDRVVVSEAPVLDSVLLAFNTRKRPFDDARVRRALSLAVDRWAGVERLKAVSDVAYVGSILRPQSRLATSEEALEALPGFGRDIQASRAEARRLLAEAGAADLKLTVMTRGNDQFFAQVAGFLAEQWRAVGVVADLLSVDTAAYFTAQRGANFDVSIEFATDFVDEPTMQWPRFLSRTRSLANLAGYTDRVLDDLFDRQNAEPTTERRIPVLRAFENRLIVEQGYWAPMFWSRRIMVHNRAMHGWTMTPSYPVGQDLAEIWLDR